MSRPLPRVEVELRRWVPGWALRVVAVVVTAGTVVLATAGASAAGGLAVFLLFVAAAIGGWVAWRPGAAPALLGAVVTAFLLAFTPSDGRASAALWLAPLAYLGVRLCVWAAATRPTARVELGALARSARVDGIVIGVTVLLGAVASLLDGGSFAGLVVGAVAVLGLVILVLSTEDGRP
ncbi:hypothetical protein [Xylanimonas protaetiae]|uniref:Uncharacterized protein n=1 Tax=Xylanimonas protaetiae TaxID=2509457 RepID=A0A4P6F812_9MICO|nr:hypothetical protein [Xylanimonas protaetiae]QAY71013.1 hypothetical protein ET471_14045 [Xylanimonas protaetiae]